MKTAIITGVAGFLGPYVAKELTERNYRVIGVDIHPADHVRVPFLGVEEYFAIRLPSQALDLLLTKEKPHVIIHAAGPSSVAGSFSDPMDDFDGSVGVLFGILNAVKRLANHCKVVICSSAAVYGNPTFLPVSEDAPPDPISPYGYHKLMCEMALAEFARIYGLKGCGIRIFSAYGRGLRRQVVWDLSKKIVESQTVRLIGTGEETRDFIHASDIACAVGVILEKARFEGEVYNLASGQQTQISHLAHLLVDSLARNNVLEFDNCPRPGDPLKWWADIRRVSQLGFRPLVSIEAGIQDFARWFPG